MIDIFCPFQWVSNNVTYELLGLVRGTHLAESLNFIVYDTLKIFFLLVFAIIFGTGIKFLSFS